MENSVNCHGKVLEFYYCQMLIAILLHLIDGHTLNRCFAQSYLSSFVGCEGRRPDPTAQPRQHRRDHWLDPEERRDNHGGQDHDGGRRTQDALGVHHPGVERAARVSGGSDV